MITCGLIITSIIHNVCVLHLCETDLCVDALSNLHTSVCDGYRTIQRVYIYHHCVRSITPPYGELERNDRQATLPPAVGLQAE